MVRGDFQEFGRIREAVNLVEDDHVVWPGGEERLGIVQERPRAGKFAVVVVGIGQGLSQRRLTDTPDAHQPDDGAELPSLGDSGVPFAAGNHATSIAYG